MMKQEELHPSMEKWHPCGAVRCGRHSGAFWGGLMIVVGLFWLGQKANWIPPEILAMFWPVMLILFGVWIIARTWRRSGSEHDPDTQKYR